jgi:diaminohydroxyphosphoribosylaminopyrimidine deaminase / 5-amino-6-(5-phosphoribosylamino)uracil reductase
MVWKDYEVAAMRRAIKLAARGQGFVEPNPMVGAVIVKNRRVVGEGHHHMFGGPHAETFALCEAEKAARGAEVFVTLEPCSHFGKTPPCADALIAAGVKRVVAAMKDPDARVAGKGFAKLRRAGIAVDVGLLADEAARLNAPYVKLRTTGMPWVVAKYAMTADGRIATSSGESHWISCEESRRVVHRLRGRVDAIVVGVGTVLVDDPLLTARPRGRRVAARVVMDSKARTPLSSKLVATAAEAPLIIATGTAAPGPNVEALREYGAEVLMAGNGRAIGGIGQGRRSSQGGQGRPPLQSADDAGRVDAAALAAELGKREMTNVLVEGGASVLGSFFAARMVDEVMIFVAPKLVGEGRAPIDGWMIPNIAAAATLDDFKVARHGCDVMLTGRVRYAQ